jgi:hypothetical protein
VSGKWGPCSTSTFTGSDSLRMQLITKMEGADESKLRALITEHQ